MSSPSKPSAHIAALRGELPQETKFVAKLKKSSEYYHQADPGQWFEIEFRYRYDNFCVCGNENVYRFADVDIGARLADGRIVKLK